MSQTGASASLNAWIPVVGTLLGVVVGGVVGYAVHWLERKWELRSVLQALLWELQDAKPRLELPTGEFGTPIPSVDTLMARGLLCSLPERVQGRVLAARSVVQLHNQRVERYERDRHSYDQAADKWEVETLTGLARAALVTVGPAIDAVSLHLGKHAISRKFPVTLPDLKGTAA